jgi:hypothetical protein
MAAQAMAGGGVNAGRTVCAEVNGDTVGFFVSKGGKNPFA